MTLDTVIVTIERQ